MRMDDLEKRMRALEYFRNMQMISHVWAIIRLDGHNFSRLTEANFEKPYDPRFQQIMEQAAQAVLTDFQGVYACTHSDEISLLLPCDWPNFGRRLEKVVSLSAGIASATFTHAAGVPAYFDSRIWLSPETSAVFDYFRWRQADGERCALNSCCYWVLRKGGHGQRAANNLLEKRTREDKNKILLQHGVVFDELPRSQRYGIGLYWEKFTKTGYNPETQSQVSAMRQRIKAERELPAHDEYSRWLATIIDTASRAGGHE